MARYPKLETIAAALGISRPRVSQLKARGMPVHAVESARLWYLDTVRPRLPSEPEDMFPDSLPPRRPVPPSAAATAAADTDSDREALRRARIDGAEQQARLLRLRADREAGELVPKAEVRRDLADAVAIFFSTLEALPDRLAPRLVSIESLEAVRAVLADELELFSTTFVDALGRAAEGGSA